MKITERMLEQRTAVRKRPNEYRESLAREAFPKGAEKFGLDQIPYEQVAYFYADMRIQAMSSDEIEFRRNEWPCLTEDRYPWPDKGLFLIGPIGTGKTTVAELLAYRMNMDYFTADGIVAEYLTQHGDDWYSEFIEETRTKPVVIDDLGSERDVRKFGNDSIIHDLIAARERTHRLYGVPTVFTGNFKTPKDVSERYGDRILSRIIGMCEVVMLTGPDRRRTC